MAMSRAHPLSALHLPSNYKSLFATFFHLNLSLKRPENEEDIAFMSVTSLFQTFINSGNSST
ncbi:hypothetical protein LguiA_015104 [Lonicera macranthoides]